MKKIFLFLIEEFYCQQHLNIQTLIELLGASDPNPFPLFTTALP